MKLIIEGDRKEGKSSLARLIAKFLADTGHVVRMERKELNIGLSSFTGDEPREINIIVRDAIQELEEGKRGTKDWNKLIPATGIGKVSVLNE